MKLLKFNKSAWVLILLAILLLSPNYVYARRTKVFNEALSLENLSSFSKDVRDNYKVFQFDSSNVFQAAVSNIIAEYNKAITEGKDFVLFLSGGSSLKALASLKEEIYADSIDWSRVHIFTADERMGVGLNHEENNAYQAYQVLLNDLIQHSGLPRDNIHRINTMGDMRMEAELYEAELQLLIDVGVRMHVVLGMGSDGHTGSIFSDFPWQKQEGRLFLDVSGESQPNGLGRITVTPYFLSNFADSITAIVTGDSKAQTIAEVLVDLENNNDLSAYPIVRTLLLCFSDILIFSDQAALSEYRASVVTQVGFVGLGAMGLGMARAISENDIAIFGTDINSETRDEFDKADIGTSAVDLEAMVRGMGAGRKVIWLMVPHGTPVNENIDKIIELKRQGLISEGDIVIDGGNSNHILHRARAERLLEEGIILLGAGTSGGTAAAGSMSIMVGGSQEAYQQCKPVFEALGMENGYNWFGEAGAGHFVKSVHNGIEYAFFQVLAEGVEVLANYFGWNQEKLAEVIGGLQDSNLSSWIMELALEVAEDDVLSHVGPHILGGSTGTWTQEDARVATPVLDATLQRRIDSREIDLENYQVAPGDFAASFIALIRNKMGSHKYDELSEEITSEMRCDALGVGLEVIDVEEQEFVENILSAITYGWLMALKEGYEVIAASEYDIDAQGQGLASLSTVWQNGSVIKSHLIGLAETHFKVGEDVQATFNNIAQELGVSISSIEWLNGISQSLNIPTPALDAILESTE